MRILALDYSTHAGYAVFDDGVLTKYGTLHATVTIKDSNMSYPWSYIAVSESQASHVRHNLVEIYQPAVIVVEETNGSKNRYTQKLLEFLHHALLVEIRAYRPSLKIVYVNTGDWRKNLGIWLTKEQKKANAKLSKAKSAANKKGTKLDKVKLGIRGKITKKHAAVNYINDRFGFKLKVKDNDAAEAICIGLAFLNDVPHCTGV